jgi:hypothetical protein
MIRKAARPADLQDLEGLHGFQPTEHGDFSDYLYEFLGSVVRVHGFFLKAFVFCSSIG